MLFLVIVVATAALPKTTPIILFRGLTHQLMNMCKAENRRWNVTWETPTFIEVKMDAEVNSYQDDFGGDRDPGV